jgi:hypothetical protein
MTVGRTTYSVLSMGERAPTGDDRSYLEWHLLDHLPEQYQLEGLLLGQRWASTPACRAARAAESDRFAPVAHVTQYLMAGEPAAVIEPFLELGARLASEGRYPVRLPSVLLGGFVPVAGHAAMQAAVSTGVVPFRPSTGVYLLLEPPPPGGADAYTEATIADELPALAEVDGVAGGWWFSPGDVRPDRFDAGGLRLLTLYLDDDPVEVAGALGERLRERWARWSVTPALAGPFETVRAWSWPDVG